MKRGWEIGQETVAWFINGLRDCSGLPHKDEYLNLSNLFLRFFILLLKLTITPALVVMFGIFILSLIAYIYKKKNNVPDDIESNSWDKLRQFLAHFFITLGKILHGHEIIGMQHIPEGPGIIVFYHGNLDIDYLYLLGNLYAQKRKICFTLTEKALFSIPGWKYILDASGCIFGNRADCVEMLKKGHLLGIAPGGTREAIFSDNYYNLIWGKRTGFAQIALEARVPIIPMFTQNIQESFRGFGKTRLVRWLYEKTRVIFIPLYAVFPVKLRTYIGEPILYDPSITAVELAEKTKIAIESLRDQYQKIPGSILRALAERFDKHHKND